MIKFKTKKGVGRAVLIPTALTLMLLSAIVGLVLHVSTARSDELAIERQNRLVRVEIRQNMAAIANDQEASTYWDDAVLRTRQRPLDMEWLDNNLGIWFHSYYKHDETYLLDPADRPIYAMQRGLRAQPASFRKVAGPTLPLVHQLRNKLSFGYLATESALGKTVGVTAISDVAGRPAIISIKPIVSETGDIRQAPGSEYLHISIRYLDGSFLKPLSDVYGIEHASFARMPGGSASLAVKNNAGAVLGYISWKPFAPGKQVENRMAPLLLVILAVIGIALGAMLSRIWRSRTELEASRAQAQHLAFHDSLTGLPNRALFDDHLKQALSRRQGRTAVMMLDLDRFKNVNDTLGHQAGDALIREFGLRLSALVREGDTIARLGGDEFALLIDNAEPNDIRQLAERILGEIKRPFELLGSHAYVGVSIGVALSSRVAMDPLELVRRADIALYRAKEGGRNGYRIFAAEMDARVKFRGTIEEELREALSSGEGLSVHYQPQVAAGGGIIGLEALVRWNHATRGIISPEQFVPIAEESGLIVPLGEWIVAEACAASRRWPHLFMSINLSPIQFRAAGFYQSLMRTIRSTGADPKSIQLEVTERVLLDCDDGVKDVLRKLRAAGFSIVLDDFGTGYSSLSYLRTFEVDKIKIDRSFIQHLGDATDSRAIVCAVLALGEALGLSVAAEGVETDEQRSFLNIAGCKIMQGYYFSRALPEEEISRLIDETGRPSAAA